MPARREMKWWKERWVEGHYAKLKSDGLLREYIKYQGISYQGLADRATRHLITNVGPHAKVSRQMISQLAQDPHEVNPVTQKNVRSVGSCSVELAAAIEWSLDVPPHLLFDVLAKPSRKRETAKAQAA